MLIKIARHYLLTLYLVLATCIYGAICLIIFPFLNHNTRYVMIKYWCKAYLFACQYLAGITYRLHGLNQLNTFKQQKISVMFLSKHQSMWETIAFFALLPQELCFVFKKELLYIPIFGWVLGMLNMLHIDRKKGSRAFHHLKQQLHLRLKQNKSPILFPEGTRTLPGEITEYKAGGVKLAILNQLPIIPIAHNAGVFYPKKGLRSAGIIDVYILPSINQATYANLNTQQLTDLIKNTIEQKQQMLN